MATESVPELLAKLDAQDCAGCAVGLHFHFTAPNFLIQTYPVAWNEHYSKNGLVMQDPTVAWALSNQGSIRWSALAEQDRAGVFSDAAKYGMRFGVMVSVFTGGLRSMGGFAHGEREFSDAEIEELEHLVRALHDVTADASALSEDDKALLASRGAQV